MTSETRPFNLSDAHILLSNDQLKVANALQVCGGMTLASARFHAWYCADRSETLDELVSKRDAAVQWFVSEYRKMLEMEYDYLIKNFDRHIGPETQQP